MVITLLGCGKVYPIFHGSAPSSVKVEKVDLTNAAALAVMPYAAGGSIQTKAGDGEEYSDRLYIVDKDGKTTLASFSFKEEGAENNKIWKKIRETLTLVPGSMIPLTKDLILLCSVTPVYEYTDWAQDAWGYEESTAINSLLNELSGPYFLRTSDGALLKSPFDIDDHHGDGNMMDIGRLLKFTPDKKQMVICPSDIIQKQSEIWLKPSGDVPNDFIPWVITDKGNSFELKMPSENLLERGYVGGIMVSDNKRIIPLDYQHSGTWSFDM